MKSPSDVKQAFLVLYWNDDFHIIIWTKESEINAEKKIIFNCDDLLCIYGLVFLAISIGGEGVDDHNVDKKQVSPIRMTRLCSKWKCCT